VACGTGLVSFQAIKKIGDQGRLLGTDISDKMVEIASSIALLKKEKRAQFEWMDAEELDLENNSFDVALCSLGLMYMPDPRKALEEMNRVLKPGGRAVAAVWDPGKNVAGQKFLTSWIRRSLRFAPCFLTWEDPICWNSISKQPDSNISAYSEFVLYFTMKTIRKHWVPHSSGTGCTGLQ
jgi:ubiquinone/menaquinone biosynthesis C-methylase UbiE